MERPVPIDHGPVLATRHHGVGARSRRSRRLTVHGRAVRRLGLDGAVLAKHAHGVPFILRALGREQRAVGQLERHPVVRVVSMTAGGSMTYPRASPNQWPTFPVRFEEEIRMKYHTIFMRVILLD